jgi:hypothetical protein
LVRKLRACIPPGAGVRAQASLEASSPAPPGSVIEGQPKDAMNEARNHRADRRHATPEPFPAWFKASFALVVGGLALLIAVIVAALSVI